MADKKYDNLARKSEFQQNDPFAELTRIIGYDRGASAEAAPADTFEIDLEREMLGDFDELTLDHANDREPTAVAAPAEMVAEPADMEAAADEIDFDSAARELVTGGEDESQGFAQADEDFALGSALDAELAREAEDWLEEPVAPEPALAHEHAFAEEAPSHAEEPVSAAQETGAEADFLDMDFNGEALDEVAASDPALLPEAEPVATMAEDEDADDVGSLEAAFEALIQDDRAGEATAEAPTDEFDGEAFDAAASEALDESRSSPAEEAVAASPSWLQSLRTRIESGVNSRTDAVQENDVQDQAWTAPDEAVEAEAPEASQQVLEEDGAAPAPAEDDPFAELAAMAAVPAAAMFTRATPTWATYRTREPEAAEPQQEDLQGSGWDGQTAAGMQADDFAAWDDVEPAAIEPAAAEAEPVSDVADYRETAVEQEETVAFDEPEAFVAEGLVPDEEDTAYEPDAAEAASEDDVPDLDVMEIVEEPVAMSDDLDLPDVAYDERPAAAQPFDDLDHELGALFGEQPGEEQAANGHAATSYLRPEDELRHAVEQAFLEEDFNLADDEAEDAEPGYSPYVAAGATAGGVYAAGAAMSAQRAAAPVHEDGSSGYGRPPAGDGTEAYSFENAYSEAALAEDPADARPHRRGLMIAAVVAGVAIVGGIGAYAFSFGGGASGTPALVKADDGPVKVRPENPGGTTVPNQDNQVYERVTTGPAGAPEQQNLVTTAEEPVDLAGTVAPPPAIQPPSEDSQSAAEGQGDDLEAVIARSGEEEGSLPMTDDLSIPMKNEDRVAAAEPEASAAGDEVPLVTPRRVRTMIVKPDGTMVPREEPEVAEQAEDPAAQGTGALMPPLLPADKASAAPTADPISLTSADAPTAEMETAASAAAQRPEPEVAAAAANEAPQIAAAAPAATETATQEPLEAVGAAVQDVEAAAAPQRVVTPQSVPVAPSRPADQPVDIVGEVRRETAVAAVEPQAEAPPQQVAASEWSVQIASQPSADAAQASYADLARRYGEVLEGKPVNIVKAEIAGKGTYYRVRIPAASRSDANAICARYKTAGGSCFVSR